MVKEVETEIEQLDGVVSCTIKGEEEIEEIHIVASKSRQPKRIVRDIETMVLVNLEQEVSHKKISIAQINNQQQDQRGKNRIELISISQNNNSSACDLKLKINGNLIEEQIKGEAELPLAPIIAGGLLDVIERYTNFKGKLRVDNVYTTGLEDEVVVAQIMMYRPGEFTGKQRLVGSAYIDHNLPLATGKACLKALNRQLASYV